MTILDLTTPPPGNEASDAPTDMETETDSTPTTPVCRSSAPSPTPFPSAPESVPIDMANPETIPHWARTPSPEDKMPHAPTFTTQTEQAPALATLMTLLIGMKSELLTHIEQVNARIDQTMGPRTIADYGVWNDKNLSAWEHPGYVNPAHDEDMEALADANAAHEAELLAAQRSYHCLNAQLTAEQRMLPLDDNEVYLEEWYKVCSNLVKSMHWDLNNCTKEMDDTLVNAWRRAEVKLNEDKFNYSMNAIYECITGTKADTSNPEGRSRFNTFTTAYNSFCTTHNFPAHEGFPKSDDKYFKHYLANSPKTTMPAPAPNPPKAVHFTSTPPIESLAPPSSSPEEFPTLQALNKAPISYASATSAFILVTR